MRIFLSVFILLFSTTSFAASQAVGAAEVGQLFAGLLVVVAVIFMGAWLAKKYNLGNRFSNNDCIKVVSLLSLGAKEKIILLEVGDEQIVVGSSNQGLQHLHTLKTPVEIKNTDNETVAPFAAQLKKLLNKSSSKEVNGQDES